ncbi:MAG: RecX family transcriptional regulator [Micavibrio aeruginosavorus]|uniref:Regulatory protein RecX n=1 Tax=Micavibrio aeruginosavorus TaxID=349221 RepID=A0A2W5BLP8_9BACT|nr:MAG: RecX family transcriptional regulator [Micavibrio aeruginosavorus]
MADRENIKDDLDGSAPKKRRREKKPPKRITEKYLYNSGLAYLQRFPTSVPNFRKVMLRKIDKSCKHHTEQDREACLTILDKTVQEFERQGYLNDEAYLRGMINSLRRRGLSAQGIAAKLQQKGLGREITQETLQEHDAQSGTENPDFAAAILLTKRKKIGPFRAAKEENRNRELAALARAGFGYEYASKALDMSREDAEEILAGMAL